MNFRRHGPNMSVAKNEGARRSPCPLACGLDLFGDRWTLLIVRDLMFGAERFKDFVTSPEHIPTNLLSDRLSRLRDHGIVTKVAAADGSRHPAYRLTSKGEALRPLLEAMRDWGLKWQKDTRMPPSDSGPERLR